MTVKILLLAGLILVLGVAVWAVRRRQSFVQLAKHEKILPLSEYLIFYGPEASFAPNLDQGDSRSILSMLSSISNEEATILVACDEDGTADRIFVSTDANQGKVRGWANEWSADAVSRLNGKDLQALRAKYSAFKGPGWRILWD